MPILLADQIDAQMRAAAALRAGELVLLPTETVYGLAALADDQTAVEQIYKIKGRPAQKALIAHVDGVQMAEQIGCLNARAHRFIDAFWPGPLTLIVPKQQNARICSGAGGGLDTIALRCPDHAFTRALLSHLGQPLVAPSANLSGQEPPIQISDVAQLILDGAALCIDGGICSIGTSSTLLDLCGARPRVLRMGGIDLQTLRQVCDVQD